MRVLSLFDGISCGRIALDKAGIKYSCYHASEIDPNAILCATTNYPDTVELGDVRDLHFSTGDYDLIIGGSPCQDLCGMGSREGLQGVKSGLFYEYLRILNEVKPKYFLLENNASMTVDNCKLITGYLKCPVYEINSSCVSAQNRRRLYWTNIDVFTPPTKNIVLNDILCDMPRVDITDKVNKYIGGDYAGRKIENTVKHGIREMTQKSRTITTSSCDFGSNGSLILHINDRYYLPNQTEFERLQTVPDGYTSMLPYKKAVFALGNGWTVDVIAHIFKGLHVEKENEHNE